MLFRHLRILFFLVGGNFSMLFKISCGSNISEGSLINYLHFIFFFSVRKSNVGTFMISLSLSKVILRYFTKNSWRYTLLMRVLLSIQWSMMILLCECMISRKCIISSSFSLSCLTTVIFSEPRVLFSENRDLEENFFWLSRSVWALGKELALSGERVLRLGVWSKLCSKYWSSCNVFAGVGSFMFEAKPRHSNLIFFWW